MESLEREREREKNNYISKISFTCHLNHLNCIVLIIDSNLSFEFNNDSSKDNLVQNYLNPIDVQTYSRIEPIANRIVFRFQKIMRGREGDFGRI